MYYLKCIPKGAILLTVFSFINNISLQMQELTSDEKLKWKGII